ncbi:hypothetical protein RGU74_09365 [Bacillus cereus]|nr:hypothetical protein [Bacillus cereus]MDR4983905.1 hypothetical protein [Bacillus cereus]
MTTQEVSEATGWKYTFKDCRSGI